jgi:glycosyltransferase involved in cell wall biosynthesis
MVRRAVILCCMVVSAPLRLLYVQPAVTVGGAERQASLLADALRAEGVETTVVSGPGSILDQWLEATGVPHRRSPHFAGAGGWRPRHWPRSVALLASLLDQLDRIHERTPFDAAVGSLGEGWLASGLFGRRHGRPVLWRAGGLSLGRTSAHLSPEALGARLMARLLRPRAIVCNARAVERYWSFMAGVPLQTIPNVVAAAADGLRPTALVARSVGYLGRIAAGKGIELLLEAFAVVAPELPHCTLVVGGPGERGPFVALAERLGLTGRVRFPGHVDDIDTFFADCDLLVLPSRSEGSPNVVLEAFARGVPVLATRVGGTEELMADGVDGWLVPPDDLRLLTGALRRALTSPDRREAMVRRARRRLEPHAPGAVASQWAALLRSVLAESLPRGAAGV